MTIQELLKIADKGYNHGSSKLISRAYGGEGGDIGDGLACFLASELSETYTPGDSDTAQLENARDVVAAARRELEDLEHQFERALERAKRKAPVRNA